MYKNKIKYFNLKPVSFVIFLQSSIIFSMNFYSAQNWVMSFENLDLAIKIFFYWDCFKMFWEFIKNWETKIPIENTYWKVFNMVEWGD